MMERLASLDIAHAKGADVQQIAHAAAMLLRDGCDVMDVLGARFGRSTEVTHTLFPHVAGKEQLSVRPCAQNLAKRWCSTPYPAITMYLIAGYDLFESKAHFQSEPNGGAFQAAINLH